MTCEYFGICGSCTYHDKNYKEQLSLKVAKIQELFDRDDIQILRSEPSHFRSRAEFKIYHDDNKLSYAMSRLDKKGVVRIDSCSIVSQPIYQMMSPLLLALESVSILEHRLFGIEFLSTSKGDILVTLIYHKKVDEAWLTEAKKLAQTLDIMIVGRSRKVKLVCEKDYLQEELTIDQKTYHFHLYETGFIQPNTGVNEKMISWVKSKLKHQNKDLLELYCGHGNFTIPLSSHFDKVLATEISKSSIKAAKENCLLNAVENITFVRLSSEELTQALKKERTFRRLEGVDLEHFDFSHILVDPPRAGLDEESLTFISHFDTILYISCNPLTLKRDLQVLETSFEIVDFAIFDQFPYTHHIESGVILKRRSASR